MAAQPGGEEGRGVLRGEESRHPIGDGQGLLERQEGGGPVVHRAFVRIAGQGEARSAVAQRLQSAQGDKHLPVLVLAGPVQLIADAVAGGGAGERGEVEVEVVDPARGPEQDQPFDAASEQDLLHAGSRHAGLGEPIFLQLVAKLVSADSGRLVKQLQVAIGAPGRDLRKKRQQAEGALLALVARLAEVGHEFGDLRIPLVAEPDGGALDALTGPRGDARVVAQGQRNGGAGEPGRPRDGFQGGTSLAGLFHLTNK
jgi:hypothetical protein